MSQNDSSNIKGQNVDAENNASEREANGIDEQPISRRMFLRRGTKAALGGALLAGGVLASNPKEAQAEKQSIEDLLKKDPKYKRDTEKREKEKKAGAPETGIGQAQALSTELLQHFGLKHGAQYAGSKGFGGIAHTQSRLQSEYKDKLTVLESSANAPGLETPDVARVEGAIRNIRAQAAPEILSARNREEWWQNVAIIIDWSVFTMPFLRNDVSKLNPFTNHRGAQMGRIAALISTIVRYWRKDKRGERREKLAERDVARMEDSVAELAGLVTQAINSKKSVEDAEEADGKEAAAKTDAETKAAAAKTDAETKAAAAKAESDARDVMSRKEAGEARTSAETIAEKQIEAARVKAEGDRQHELAKLELEAKLKLDVEQQKLNAEQLVQSNAAAVAQRESAFVSRRRVLPLNQQDKVSSYMHITSITQSEVMGFITKHGGHPEDDTI
jgi:hypothetical protein